MGLSYCRRMQRTVDMILGLTAAVATALLLGLIARDDVGMSADMIRIDAICGGCQRISAEAEEVRHPGWRSEEVKHQHGARAFSDTYGAHVFGCALLVHYRLCRGDFVSAPEGPLARLLKFLILFVAGVAILHKLQPYGLVGVAVFAYCFLSLLSIYRSVIRNPHL